MSSSEDEDYELPTPNRVPENGHRGTAAGDAVPEVPPEGRRTWVSFHLYHDLEHMSSLEMGNTINTEVTAFNVYDTSTKNVLTMTNVIPMEIESYTKRKRKLEEIHCALCISRRHPNLLKHRYLIHNGERIIGLVSERSHQNLERVFLNLGGNLPELQTSMRQAQELSRALYHLHEEHIIHGMLAAHFVHFDSGGHVKLFLPPVPFFKLDRTSCYTSPEMRDTIAPATTDSDNYSLGCLIFRLLHARDPKNNMKQVQLRTDLPEGLRVQLERCWTQEGSRPTAREMLLALLESHPR